MLGAGGAAVLESAVVAAGAAKPPVVRAAAAVDGLDPLEAPDSLASGSLASLERPERLAALHRTGLLGSPAEDRLDGFTRLAAQILGVSTVVISLVEEHSQYFKSACGRNAPSAGWYPLDACYCQDVIGSGKPLVLADAWNEPEFSSRGSRIRAYARIPLVTSAGQIIGAFCA